MFRVNTAATSLALLLMGSAGPIQAAGESESSRSARDEGAVYSRHAWTEVRGIPDGDRRGILIGPVLTDHDGVGLGSVVLQLNICHPAVGDLDIWLAYDEDGDGDLDARAPVELFRMQSEFGGEALYACPQSLDGTYFFRDGTGEGEAGFAPFRALRRGHGFYLAIADTLAEDTGSVRSWAVYTENPEPLAQR